MQRSIRRDQNATHILTLRSQPPATCPAETFAKLRHSGESRPFTGRNVHPEGAGKRGSDYQCVGLKRWRGVLQRPHTVKREPCATQQPSTLPLLCRDHCKTSRTSLFSAAKLAREAERSRDSRFPTRQTRSKPPLIPPWSSRGRVLYWFRFAGGEPCDSKEGGPASQTAAANSDNQHAQITAHHSNQPNHSSDDMCHPKPNAPSGIPCSSRCRYPDGPDRDRSCRREYPTARPSARRMRADRRASSRRGSSSEP